MADPAWVTATAAGANLSVAVGGQVVIDLLDDAPLTAGRFGLAAGFAGGTVQAFRAESLACTDVDECKTAPCAGDSTCENTQGAFVCTCPGGFVLSETGCNDVDECLLGTHNCSPKASCENSAGSFACTCNPGWVGDGTACIGVKDCDVLAAGCDDDASCSNTLDGPVCTCDDGWTGDGVSCADVDECAESPGCHVNATCVNEDGGYECVCNPGWTGSGELCGDINECAGDGLVCQGDATCDNTPGGFECVCPPGYAYDLDEGCKNVDECQDGTAGCDPNAICSDTVGGFKCACNAGWTGNGKDCVDQDECASGAHDCHTDAQCQNVAPGWTCQCNSGFAGDGIECSDVNECATSAHDCPYDENCQNTSGGWTCKACGLLINDGFDGGVLADYWTETSGTWSASPGTVSQTDLAGAQSVLLTGKATWGDFGVSVRLQRTDGSGTAGVVLRVNGDVGYYVGLGNGIAELLEYDNIQITPLATVAAPSAGTLKWDSLVVRAEGATIQAFVNGALAFTFTDEDEPMLNGAVGLASRNGAANFDRVRVQSVDCEGCQDDSECAGASFCQATACQAGLCSIVESCTSAQSCSKTNGACWSCEASVADFEDLGVGLDSAAAACAEQSGTLEVNGLTFASDDSTLSVCSDGQHNEAFQSLAITPGALFDQVVITFPAPVFQLNFDHGTAPGAPAAAPDWTLKNGNQAVEFTAGESLPVAVNFDPPVKFVILEVTSFGEANNAQSGTLTLDNVAWQLTDCVGCIKNTDCEDGEYCLDSFCEPQSGIGGPCISNTSCAVGLCANKLCRCTSDTECEAYCLNGGCVQCAANEHCAEGQFCGPAKTCAAAGALGAECSTNSGCTSGACAGDTCVCDEHADCSDGLYCKDAKCTQCSVHAHCAGEEFCNDAGQCTPDKGLGESCSTNAKCLSQFCSGGLCACNDHGDCPAGSDQCAEGACVECITDAECGSGKFCSDAHACNAVLSPGAPCSKDSMCTTQDCGPTGTCLCLSKSHCAANNICTHLGECFACGNVANCQCATSADCATSKYCSGKECVDCTQDGHCGAESYCTAGNACTAKKAVGASCGGNNECDSADCDNKVCVCQSANDCTDDLLCVDGDCAECGENGDCGGSEYCLNTECKAKKGLEVSCGGNVECLSGHCTNGKCKECGADNECTSSEYCAATGDCETQQLASSPCDADSQCKAACHEASGQCTCDLDSHCAGALVCAAAGGTVCGECKNDAGCGSLENCVSNNCADALPVGQPCKEHTDCISDTCEIVAGTLKVCQCDSNAGCTAASKPYCSTAGTCTECQTHGHCANNKYCNGAGTCANDKNGNSNCTDAQECKSNACTGGKCECAVNSHCAASNPICVSLSCEQCAVHADCGFQKFCKNNNCKFQLNVGEICKSNAECKSNSCNSIGPFKVCM